MTFQEAVNYLGKAPANASTYSSTIMLTYLINKGIIDEAAYQEIFIRAVEERKRQDDADPTIQLMRKLTGELS